MTPERLAEIEARLRAATPGPWADMGDTVAFPGEIRACASFALVATDPDGDDRPGDRALIAHAPTDLAELIAEVRTLTAEREQLRVAVADLLGLGPNWPPHGNASLAVAAVVSVLRDTCRDTEIRNDALTARVAELEEAGRMRRLPERPPAETDVEIHMSSGVWIAQWCPDAWFMPGMPGMWVERCGNEWAANSVLGWRPLGPGPEVPK